MQLDRSPKSTPDAGCSRCFWAGKGQPINPIGDPYAIYMEIFGGAPAAAPGPTTPALKRLCSSKKSILDYVGRNLDAFKARLGTEDRMAIDAHQQSVRDLETQLQAAAGRGRRQVRRARRSR